MAQSACTPQALTGALDQAVARLASAVAKTRSADADDGGIQSGSQPSQPAGITRKSWGSLSIYGGVIVGGGMSALGATLKFMDYGGKEPSEKDELAGDVLMWGGLAVGVGLLVTGLVLVFLPDEDTVSSTTASVLPSSDGRGLSLGVCGRW